MDVVDEDDSIPETLLLRIHDEQIRNRNCPESENGRDVQFLELETL